MPTRSCKHCSHLNRTQAIYCGACGQRLADGLVAHQPFPAGQILGAEGRYAIQEMIGRGGFGEAYLVKRLRIKPDTPPAQVSLISASFEREARLSGPQASG